MPKVNTWPFVVIDGDSRFFDVWYTNKAGFWLKDFPQSVWELGANGNAPGADNRMKSEDDLRRYMNTALEKYHEAKKSVRKVIKVNLCFGIGFVMNEAAGGYGFSGAKQGAERLLSKVQSVHDPSHTIGLDYEVCFLKGENGQHLHYMTEEGEVGGKLHDTPEKSLLLDWTEEREAFMRSSMDVMEKLAQQLIAFFGKDEKELVHLIDTKGALFLTNGEDK